MQKCVRAGGKHNDLDEIGRTKRHLTFFEMLGNFSFGDYFKERAIPWAWEFVTEVLGLDPDRLWVTVHTTDDEAEADLARRRRRARPSASSASDEDNSGRWPTPAPAARARRSSGTAARRVRRRRRPAHGGEERFVEIWNLVFMQYDQQRRRHHACRCPSPASTPARASSASSRCCRASTPSSTPTSSAASSPTAERAHRRAPTARDERTDVSLRILADHARAMTFLVTDGVVPCNEERGYVLRRIIRRAVRHAYLLGVEELVTPALVDEVVGDHGRRLPRAGREPTPSCARPSSGRRALPRRRCAPARPSSTTRWPSSPRAQALPGDVAFQLHDTSASRSR